MHIVAGDIDLYSFQSEAICRDWMAGIYFYYILFRNKQRQYIKEEKSAFGRGGMHSKYTTAQKVQQAGIRVIIANGERENILTDLIERKTETPHTEFIPCN